MPDRLASSDFASYMRPTNLPDGRTLFPTTLEALAKFKQDNPPGSRWVKVNLHVHGRGLDPSHLVEAAREANLDLIAITDHQTFQWYKAVANAAAKPGRPLTVLPGIEITSLEGVHLLALFPSSYSSDQQSRLYGWLEIDGRGDTSSASKRSVSEICQKIESDEEGLIIVPHPFAQKIGLLDSARKLSTKMSWLDSGHIRLIQISETVNNKVKYIGHDKDGNWVNRYVLASSSDEQIAASKYSFAVMNRSDVHSLQEIGEGCSWFRLQDLSIDGLKQVACEPRTRISSKQPSMECENYILGIIIHNGYCGGQTIRFNSALNCLVGQNHAGKSTILDLIRFALGHEQRIPADARENLLRRLNATLGPEGNIELFVQKAGIVYIIKRMFAVDNSFKAERRLAACHTKAAIFRYEEQSNELIPAYDFDFPVEVYEQGRVHDLRNDVGRQLDMIDEFAGVPAIRQRRAETVRKLKDSAEVIYRLRLEREQLSSKLTQLHHLKSDLETKSALLQDSEETAWGQAETFVSSVEALTAKLATSAKLIEYRSQSTSLIDEESWASEIFHHSVPSPHPAVALPGTLNRWHASAQQALDDIEASRMTILRAIRTFEAASSFEGDVWRTAKTQHEQEILDRLKQVGIESSRELLNSISDLRLQVHDLESVQRPRLLEVEQLLAKTERERINLVSEFRLVNEEITNRRKQKADELTAELGQHIRVEIDSSANTDAYLKLLENTLASIGTDRGRIQSKDAQLRAVVERIDPLSLAQALERKGIISQADGSETTLSEQCCITPNTASVLCSIARDMRMLNQLATVETPDVPRIMVRRRGEASFADLRTGLSPGEQSAAILTLALETRSAPLLLDQPEDELGYSYVVHLVVPKILKAKFSRQMLVVTHNANIAVLGDADLVVKMENRPQPSGARCCIAAATGGFESKDVTAALLELEGGLQAFQYRQHRYSLKNAVEIREREN